MKNNIYVKGHEQFAIGKEVHVQDLGNGPFFTVQKIHDGNAHLSTRYSNQIKHVVGVDRCRFTQASAKLVVNEKLHAEKSTEADEPSKQITQSRDPK